jgi:GNAT superfamily N-acetyltransferase
MKLRTASPEQVALVYERDMRGAFPPSELKPLANIQAMCEDGWYRPLCLFDGAEIAGECFLWLGHPGWALLDYLCVAESRRNQGLGAVILSELRRAESDTVILGESEAPEHAPDPPVAKRRLGFYARNGLRTAGYDTDIFGVHYKTLYLAPGPVDDEALMAEHRFIYQNRFSRRKYEQFVRIPRDPSTGPFPQTPWNED